MKLRNALGATLSVAGATALANRLLASRAGEFEPFLDGEHGTYRWRGFDVAYTERGDPDDQDLLLCHGIGAASSSHQFWGVLDGFSEEYHVIALDLPGFGHSDRPPLLYSGSLYTTFVRDAIAELTDEPPVVVAPSLSGAYAAIAASDADVETRSLVLVCPTDSTFGGRRVWLRALVRSPLLGQGLFNLATSKSAIRHFNTDHGYYDADNIPEEVVEYEWLSAHQPGARFAPASFFGGFLDPDEDLGEALVAVDAPVTLVWGRNAEVAPLSEGRELAERADTGLVVFDRTKLLPHAEHPEEFVETIREEIL